MIRSHLEESLSQVASAIDEPEEFRRRAKAVAGQPGAVRASSLTARLHSPPAKPPPGFGVEERGLGGWLAAWQFAIFEVLLNYGEPAIPELKRIAFGEYDWTQGNAIEVLARLAARDVAQDEIVAELRREFPEIRFEAQLYAVGPLLFHAAHDPAVAAIVRRMEDLPAWREAVEELTSED